LENDSGELHRVIQKHLFTQSIQRLPAAECSTNSDVEARAHVRVRPWRYPTCEADKAARSKTYAERQIEPARRHSIVLRIPELTLGNGIACISQIAAVQT